ncbi:MAG TPA: DUF5668 domain-containing protein [Bryobacteraceae bacterium]|nr:DUF5668 domain-containing protein [Bryobacteraceae bacterium]
MVPGDIDFTSEPKQRRLSPGAVIAILLIAVGALLFLDQNGIIDAWRILRYWPLALIAVGLLKLAQRDCGSRAGAIILIVIGVLNSGWAIGFATWSRMWPLLIIIVGGVLLWNALSPQRDDTTQIAAERSRLNEWALFGGGERKLSMPDFERGDLLAIFGGFDIDLRRAGMKSGRAVIEANCLFGGITLKVPEDWNVIMRGTGIFGGYSDSTRHPRAEEVPMANQLLVRGIAMFGGVDVKN